MRSGVRTPSGPLTYKIRSLAGGRSDVIVRADSPFLSFADLRGAVWAYNEPRSHSGYNVVRYHLAAKGMPAAYFGRVVESGSHHNSLQMILQRSIDAAAIDSTVLEAAGFRRFVRVSDHNYDPIRKMDQIAEAVEW